MTFKARTRSDRDVFRDFAGHLQRRTGIVLSPDKRTLVEARLARWVGERSRFPTTDALLEHLLTHNEPELERRVIDALTTNTTAFFREVHHFDILKAHVVPERAPQLGCRPFRAWSAACSSGEEAYSIAIVLDQERAAGRLGDFKILATDLSSKVLQVARSGIYPSASLKTIPPDVLRAVFVPLPFERRFAARIHPSLAATVSFHPLNLIHGPWRLRHTFDVIFCRNVLIYFDAERRLEVVSRLIEHLSPQGYLFLGHSDTALAEGLPLEAIGPTAYRLRPPQEHS